MKDLDIERLSWIIQVTQSNPMGLYKWITFPACGQRGKWDFGRRAWRDVMFLILKMEEGGGRQSMRVARRGGKCNEQTLLEPSDSSVGTALPTSRF